MKRHPLILYFLLAFFISTVATSVLIGWLFNHARGSVLIAALFHAVMDVGIAFSGVMSGSAVLFWVFVAVQVVAAAAVSPDLLLLKKVERYPREALPPRESDAERPSNPRDGALLH